jgi:hypothetical protein
MSDLVNSAPGQCRLQVDSTSQVSLQRFAGGYLPLKIGGNWEAKLIPSTGPTLANTGLTAATLYYLYAYDNSGTLTLEASTTGHVTDSDTGVEVKSGDVSRTLVGAALMGAGTPGTFQAIGVGTLSWFNGSPEGTIGNPVAALTTGAYGPLWKLTPLDQSGWSWVNQDSAAVVQSGGVVYLTSGAANSEIHARVVAAPSTPYTITAAIIPHLGVGNSVFGITFYDGTKFVQMGVRCPSGDPRGLFSGRRENSVSSHASQVESPQFMAFGMMFLRISDNGTNTKLEYSLDGVNFTTLIDEARGTFLTTGPTHVGIFLQCFTDPCGVSVISWQVS